MKEAIKQVIADQRANRFTDPTMERDFDFKQIEGNEIVVISGVRRCGKSVLLAQIRARQKEQDYYINFDDDRLIRFSVDNFQELYEVFLEFYGKQKTFYFDEIQNIAGWERFVRRLHDEGNKIYLTGSSANLLSRELGTHLTGRHIQIELFPFSFKEYLKFKNISWDKISIHATTLSL